MDYWIEVTYLPDFLVKSVSDMIDLFPDFQGAAFNTHFKISPPEGKSFEDIKREITVAFESAGCLVENIKGGLLE